MKKKLTYIVLILLLILCTGCSKKVQGDQAESKKESENNKKDDTIDKMEDETSKEEKPLADGTEDTVLPELPGEAVITGMAEEILAGMTVEEKVGQLFVVNLEALDNSRGNFYEFKDVTNYMISNIRKYNVGGICLFSRNIQQREQTINLIHNFQKISKFPLFITVDEEGGDVSRVASNDNMQTTKFTSMEEVGNFDDAEYAYNVGATIGEDIRKLGFNVNFAPVADVKTNEYNTEIGSRSFGSDPKLVARMVTEVVKGLQDQRISATLKHFPGHGDAGKDSHEGAVNVENDIERLREVEFVPFRAGIKAGADFVMVSHISISRITENTVPASLSPLVMNQMLRTELGFEGIIITDAMNMKSITDSYNSKQAALKALKAGVDIILTPDNFEEAYLSVLHAVQKGSISKERLDASVTRILETKIRRGIITENSVLIQK